MRSRTLMVAAIVGVFMLPLWGCMKEETSATESEEKAYRNPSKEPPPEASMGTGAPQQAQGGQGTP